MNLSRSGIESSKHSDLTDSNMSRFTTVSPTNQYNQVIATWEDVIEDLSQKIATSQNENFDKQQRAQQKAKKRSILRTAGYGLASILK